MVGNNKRERKKLHDLLHTLQQTEDVEELAELDNNQPLLSTKEKRKRKKELDESRDK